MYNIKTQNGNLWIQLQLFVYMPNQFFHVKTFTEININETIQQYKQYMAQQQLIL